MDDATLVLLERLRKIRTQTDLTIKPTPLLRTSFRALDGKERPLSLRYYQVQMICHLLAMPRFVVGDDTGLGKTLESIASLAYLWARKPDTKVLILTKKSAVRQWADEFNKFTTGVSVFICKGNPKQRAQIREDYEASTGPTVMLMGHRSAVQDFTALQDKKWGVFVLDEATVAKNPSTQAHQVCRHLSAQSERAWGLTATLIKNNLVEGFGVYKVIHPPLFTHSTAAFIKDYCVTMMQNIGRGRMVPVIKGYRKSDIERFRLKIEPFYLGRPKHAVASELPPLTTKRVRVGMSSIQHLKYQEALTGLLEVGGEEKEVTKLTAVTYCQEIVNHPELIQCDGDSEKLDELVEILSEGDLEKDKVIVFTRFEKMVTIGVKALEKKGIKCVRITGKEDEDERKAAQDVFQNPDSDVRVVWITTAGSDAINLQAAKAIVFYDTPFSAGDYLQTLGRMIRIGSIHDRVFALHLVCEDTIDERVMDIMDKKMALLEAVLGKRIKGEEDDEDDVIEAEKGNLDALFEALRNDARGILSV
jgi:SNF2 family DNA or RNA helicase